MKFLVTRYAYTYILDSWYSAPPEQAGDPSVFQQKGALQQEGETPVLLVGGRTATLEITQGYRIKRDGTMVPAPGGLQIKETGQRVFNGDLRVGVQDDETALALGEPLSGISIRLVLERVPIKRTVNGPPGRTCEECAWWDFREGKKLLTEKNNRGFQEGGYCFPDVVARALADEFRMPYLHPDTTGYCPRRREILGPNSEACEEFKEVVKKEVAP